MFSVDNYRRVNYFCCKSLQLCILICIAICIVTTLHCVVFQRPKRYSIITGTMLQLNIDDALEELSMVATRKVGIT